MSDCFTEFDVGDTIQLEVTFSVLGANPPETNPTTVRLRIVSPSGDEAAPTVITSPDASLINPSAGVWYYELAITEPGLWRYDWKGTGAVEALVDRQFRARESLIPSP